MENIVRLPSQQSVFNAVNNLVDLVIPSNSGVYDLSSTFITLLTTLPATALDPASAADGAIVAGGSGLGVADAIADMRLGFNHTSNATGSIYDSTACPIELLVRNCSLISETKGMVENLRRSDVLRGTRKAYLQDIEDVEGNAITGTAGQAKSNPWANGGYHAQLNGVGSVMSAYRSHDLRIYLKDLFNFGEVTAYDSALHGSLHIHLELNINRLRANQNLYGEGLWRRQYHNFSITGNAGNQQGPIATYDQATQLVVAEGGAITAQDFIEMAAVYSCIEDHPFHVGMMCNILTTIVAGATGVPAPAAVPATGTTTWGVITEIRWSAVTKKVTLYFGGTVISCGTVTGLTGTNVLTMDFRVRASPVTAASLVPAAVSYDSCELTAVRRTDIQAGPSNIQYTQYQQQADQFSSTTTLNRSYFLPPQTTNAIICLPVGGQEVPAEGGAYSQTNGSDLLGSARLSSYRFTVNGDAVTNRPVTYMPEAGGFLTTNPGVPSPKNNAGSSLHYDLISKTFMNQGERFYSLNENVFDQDIPMSTRIPDGAAQNYIGGWKQLADAPDKRCYMLSLPIPLSNDQTQLTIELDGAFPASAGQILIYSEVNTTL